ncbi:cation efflux family-domain-containing protein [Corynascus novoguineensis]|uniref:Cation efflux family-domain-containing protein n=1 Tax=Corynascus novoguineensis TaxID=1126955 RepID=A0AAN7CXT2_9PEZI|nr:cation efflux family-domain-containing protein [Corynascus novoguineensis]
MASSPPPIEPPGTPPIPAVVALDDSHQKPSFQFTCNDYDRDRDQQKTDPPLADSLEEHEPFLAASPRSSPAAFLHPDHSTSPRLRSSDPAFTMSTDDGPESGGSPAKNPFNFQTQFISTGPVKSNFGQRRGHRYKHSSISAQHQIFQEPPPRPPPVLPASLPIPTLKEAWSSMESGQRARLWWCCCHAIVAMYVFFSAEGSLAMTALSHLVFFDVGSAAVCVAVDVLGNFEVWRRSSIRHPFGLQRAEVLAGFAMSVFLVFGGFDLISHNLKHFLETVGDHAPHHPTSSPATNTDTTAGSHGHSHHSARYIPPGTVDFTSLAAVVSTLVSAYGLRNHGRIRRVMRAPFPYLARLLPGAGILANPFHFLTLCFSFLMLLLPLLSIPHLVWLDRLICAVIAASMFVLGTRLAVAQGLMLLMSYSELPSSTATTAASAKPGSNSSIGDEKKTGSTFGSDNTIAATPVSSVIREIEAQPHVAKVEEAQFWEVHYGLAMANLKVRLARGCSGNDDSALSQLRARLARVVQNRLAGEGGYGRGGNLRWEVTVQTCSSSDG